MRAGGTVDVGELFAEVRTGSAPREVMVDAIERLRAAGARFVGLDELDLEVGLTPVGQPQPPLAAPMG